MGAVVGNTFYFDFEVRLMEFLQNALGESAIGFISQLSALGEEMILITIMGFLYWCYDKKIGAFVGTNIMVSVVMNPLIKNIFWRRRPYFDNETIKCLRPVNKNADIYDISAQGFSFPSGHSTNSAVAYGSLARCFKNPVFKVLAFVAPFCIGFSRVVVGCHYPTDVVVGWLCGAFIIFFIPFVIGKFSEEKKWIAYCIIFFVACLGLFYCKTSDYFTGLGLLGGFFCADEFDRRVVKFENTKNPVFWATRLAGGLIIYMALNNLLKLPFSKEFLNSGVFLAGLVRTLRYFIVSFVAIGVYPFVFRIEDRFKKAEK